MKRWIATPLFYVTAFFANALFLVSSLWLFLRATEAPSEAGDSYYGVVEIAPAILTVLPATLAIWMLRRLARRTGRTNVWQWAVAGAAIGFAWIWLLGRAGLAVERAYFSQQWQSLKSGVQLALLDGPMSLSFYPWWLPLPALAATAALLFFLQRSLGWQTASNKKEGQEVRK